MFSSKSDKQGVLAYFPGWHVTHTTQKFPHKRELLQSEPLLSKPSTNDNAINHHGLRKERAQRPARRPEQGTRMNPPNPSGQPVSPLGGSSFQLSMKMDRVAMKMDADGFLHCEDSMG
jgi:hypothetical protein